MFDVWLKVEIKFEPCWITALFSPFTVMPQLNKMDEGMFSLHYNRPWGVGEDAESVFDFQI